MKTHGLNQMIVINHNQNKQAVALKTEIRAQRPKYEKRELKDKFRHF